MRSLDFWGGMCYFGIGRDGGLLFRWFGGRRLYGCFFCFGGLVIRQGNYCKREMVLRFLNLGHFLFFLRPKSLILVIPLADKKTLLFNLFFYFIFNLNLFALKRPFLFWVLRYFSSTLFLWRLIMQFNPAIVQIPSLTAVLKSFFNSGTTCKHKLFYEMRKRSCATLMFHSRVNVFADDLTNVYWDLL